jgi:hypothetical protein
MEIKPNFVYPEIKETDYRFGSSPLAGEPLRPDGDWRGFLPPQEDQNVMGVESSACYVEASQHAIATIEEETFGEVDNNYSARFNALLSNGTESGGDPLRAAESFRKDGLVRDIAMPFINIDSWEEFHSWKGVVESSVRALGQRYLMGKKLGYDIVCERNQSVATKYTALRGALGFSPCPVSVAGWYERNGEYYKPEGMRDNHLTLAVYLDDKNRLYVWDTYAPYLKILEPNYNVEFAMRWTVQKKTQQEQLSYLRQLLLTILEWLKRQPVIGAIIS